ncbi:MAG: sortase [Patescibacteria group bacterium]|nr:sortase [Patescibacteria group bacterium]
MSQTGHSDFNHQDLIQIYRKSLAQGQSLHCLDQKVAKKIKRMKVASKIEAQKDKEKSEKLEKSLPMAVRLGANALPAMLIVVGFLLLGSAVVPILSFYVKNFPEMISQNLVAPIPASEVLDVTPLVVAQANNGQDLGQKLAQVDVGPVIVDAELDYTNLSNWFDDSSISELKNRTSLLSDQTGRFTLEIPEVDLPEAVVKIGGTNLDESLIQYPGTSLPGKPGSPVIFGHSVLRQFYNPKINNPRRYNSIFSYIMTLEKGDKIYATYGDVRYTYMVQSKTEVSPTDTFILSQDYSQRLIKLVTCVPEGTYLKRGVVTAQLVKE